MNRLISIFIFVFFGTLVFSQEDLLPTETNQSIFSNEKSGGLLLHTNGLGANFRYAKRVTGFTKTIFSLEAVNIKHAKEYKSHNPFINERRGYVYGKLNSFLTLRPSFGSQKIIYSKYTQKGVQISTIFLGGLNIGFLKPIYYEIARYGDQTNVYEKFDSNNHQIENIWGKAPFLYGIEETKLIAGIHGKFAFNFEYSPIDEKISAVEAGVNVDVFPKKVPIMQTETNRWIYTTLFVNIQFGSKYN